MPDLEFSAVDPSAQFTSASKPYVPAPVNEMLKFHVAELELTEQRNKYEKNPDGTDNPNFDKPQPVLIFKAELDEGEAAGQVYSKWITGYYQNDDRAKPAYSFGPRSTFGPIAEALAGSVEAFQKLTAAEIVGLPFQCALEQSKKDPAKQVLNALKIMPPSKDQKKVAVAPKDVVPTEVGLSEDEVEQAFAAV